MSEIIHPISRIAHRRGIALLAVLFIVMAITVLSLGFMARSTTEVSCGQNMARRVEMDQLAASGLEQARGLLLQPQEAETDFWTGATGVQIVSGSSNAYDVTVLADSTDKCTYAITADAYRTESGEKLDRSALTGKLRLDPALALWTGTDTCLGSTLTIQGDVYCGSNLAAQGTLSGDVFAAGTITATAVGQKSALVTTTPVEWPFGTQTAAQMISTFTTQYTWQSLASTTLSSNLGTAGVPCVFYRSGDLTISSSVTINGLLLVDGNLTVSSNSVSLVATKNLPALYVTGNLFIKAVDGVSVTGLAVVDGDVYVSGGATSTTASGALFVKNSLLETTPEAMGTGCDGILRGPPTRATGRIGSGALQFDGTDDYVQTVGTIGPFTVGYTLAFWINADSTQNSAATILARHDGTTHRLLTQFNASGQLIMSATAGMWSATGITLANVTGGWHHVCVTVTSGWAMDSYLDGAWKSTTTLFGGGAVGACYVYLGANGTAAATSIYKGLLDDVQMYGVVLSAADIATLASGASASSTPWGQWCFDEAGADLVTEADPVRAAIVVWLGGVRTNWSPAGGAFFKQVSRASL